MEEYGLNQDNANYQGALETYQNDLITKDNLQAAKDRAADEAHEAWSIPVNVIGGDLTAKPIKTFLKAKAKGFIKKGISKGEQIVADRLDKAGSKLKNTVGDSLFKGDARPFQGTSSSLEDAYQGSEPLTGTAESLRNSVARLRQLTGGRPLGSGGEPVRLKDIKTPDTSGADAPTPWDNPQPSSDTLDSLRGEARTVNIGDTSETAQLAPEQQDAVNSILQGEDPARALFKYRMKTMDVPTASQARANLPADQPTDASSQAQRFQSRLNQVDTTNPQANSGNTADDLADDADNVADNAAKQAAKAAAKQAAKAATPAVEGLEGAEVGADAAAASEGGLNPIADLVALGVGIASLFGANAPSKDATVKYSPINPTMEHGI